MELTHNNFFNSNNSGFTPIVNSDYYMQNFTLINSVSEKSPNNKASLNVQEQSNGIRVDALGNITSFLSMWDTRNTNYQSSASNQVKLPLIAEGVYSFTIDWGDNSSSFIDAWDQSNVTHTYEIEGIYLLNITGSIVGWQFNNEGDRLKILEILQWGNLKLGNSGGYFYGSENLILSATDNINLNGTNNMNDAFHGCIKLGSTPSMGNWNTSNVTSMISMFELASSFNANIGTWDVSNVTNMVAMFSSASVFNQDINMWNVSKVSLMGSMFYLATSFNKPLNMWNVSRVEQMPEMFAYAFDFNQNINTWNLTSLRNIQLMFNYASSFNQPLDNWKFPNLTSLSGLFSDAISFNQPINSWDVSNVSDFTSLFENAVSFNQLIGSWDLSKAEYLNSMFEGAISFNQPIGNWNVSSVVFMDYMFHQAIAFNQPIGSWNVASVVGMEGLFFDASSFNQDISNWDVSNVQNMRSLFASATSFSQDISNWDVSSVSYMNFMFYQIGMTTEIYDRLLSKWSQLSLQYQVTFDAGSSLYSNAGLEARQLIKSTYNWIIADGGSVIPSPPRQLTGSISGNSINLSWSPPSTRANTIKEYLIYRSTTSGGGYGLRGSTTSLSYQDQNIKTGETFYYVVTAVNNYGESGISNELRLESPVESFPVPFSPISPILGLIVTIQVKKRVTKSL